MKFSSTLLLVLPLMAEQVVSVPIFGGSAIAPRAAQANTNNNANANSRFGGFGGFGQGRGQNRGANNANNNNAGKGATTSTSVKSTAASSSSVRATSSSSAAPAASSSAAATNNAAKGNNNGGGNNGGGDPQKSLQLDPSQVQPNLANDGQDNPDPGQVKSLTSVNNFINYCLTQKGVPLTNGQQVKSGSCNPTPMGRILSTDRLPSSKFLFPLNFSVLKANTAFTIKMGIKNLVTGNFVNAQANYYAAPAQVDGSGTLIGHSHVVVSPVKGYQDTAVADVNIFSFFKGLNAPASGGALTADVTGGLPAGTYKLCSINTAANHQPALASIAQHASMDDCVYFEVTADGKPSAAAQAILGSTGGATGGNGNAGNGNGNNGGAATTAKGGAATTTAKAATTSTKAAATTSTKAAATPATGNNGKGGANTNNGKGAANNNNNNKGGKNRN